MDLENGSTKSPDFSHYDPYPTPGESESGSELLAYRRAHPTLLWELALSAHARKLGRDCARWGTPIWPCWPG